MKKITKLGIVLFTIFILFVFATTTTAVNQIPSAGTGTVFSILGTINGILRVIVPILIALAVVYFIWGVITYMIAKDDEQKKASRSKIINGLIAMLVIVAFWGILAIVMKTFGIGTGLSGDIVPCTPYWTTDTLGNSILIQDC